MCQHRTESKQKTTQQQIVKDVIAKQRRNRENVAVKTTTPQPLGEEES